MAGGGHAGGSLVMHCRGGGLVPGFEHQKRGGVVSDVCPQSAYCTVGYATGLGFRVQSEFTVCNSLVGFGGLPSTHPPSQVS